MKLKYCLTKLELYSFHLLLKTIFNKTKSTWIVFIKFSICLLT